VNREGNLSADREGPGPSVEANWPSGGQGASTTDFGAEAVPLRGGERRLEVAEHDARMRLVLGRRWR
jgi:hypothetical protein